MRYPNLFNSLSKLLLGGTLSVFTFGIGALPCCGQVSDDNAYKELSKRLSSLGEDHIIFLDAGKYIYFDLNDHSVNRLYEFAMFCNQAVTPALLYQGSGLDISHIYEQILTQAEWAQMPLLKTQRDQLGALRKQLFIHDQVPTPAYTNYLAKKRRYEDLKQKYDATAEEQRTEALKLDLQQADDDLLLAHSNVFGPAEEQYHELLDLSSSAWIASDRDNFRRSQMMDSAGRPFWPALFGESFLDTSKIHWTTFVISGSQLRFSQASPPFSRSIDPNASWWRWFHGGTFPSVEHLASDTFQLEFDAVLLPIRRDWFDSKILGSDAWRWRDGQQQLLSDGKDEENAGSVPAVVNGLVLVRNVQIVGLDMANIGVRLHDALQRKERVAFGPFTLVGSVDTFWIPPLSDSSRIFVPYPQVIAVVVSVFPKSPNPNSDYQWDSQ